MSRLAQLARLARLARPASPLGLRSVARDAPIRRAMTAAAECPSPDPFPAPPAGPRVIVVAGPEATGTRALTTALSAHPAITGTTDASTHVDLLDPVWAALGAGAAAAAAERFRALADREILLTRRSLPHGPVPGASAEYRRFPPLAEFLDLAVACGRSPVLLITTRSPLAHVVSWARERASVRNDPTAALRQYWAAYRLLFGVCARGSFPFHLVSLEALALEGDAFVASLFALLGLPPAGPAGPVSRRADVNLRRYRDAWLAPAP